MARGSLAKENVEKKIASAFGADYIGTYDKKTYVWANDGEERVQIAISLTCPKVQVGAVAPSENLDFENPQINAAAPTTFAPAEFTQEEKDTITKLMQELGL